VPQHPPDHPAQAASPRTQRVVSLVFFVPLGSLGHLFSPSSPFLAVAVCH